MDPELTQGGTEGPATPTGPTPEPYQPEPTSPEADDQETFQGPNPEGEDDFSSGGESEELGDGADTGEEDPTGGADDNVEGTEADGSASQSTYDPVLMNEIHNRQSFFKKFSELRDIFTDIAQSSDTLAADMKDSKKATLAKTAWDNLVYVNKKAEEKEDQLSLMLQSDVFATLEVVKLHKIFLAFQRIATKLVDSMEQVERSLQEDVIWY